MSFAIKERINLRTNKVFYAEARYYNPGAMRFNQQDPSHIYLASQNFSGIIGVDRNSILLDPQQLNSYSYVRNNPITNSDPSGQFSIPSLATIKSFLVSMYGGPKIAYAPSPEQLGTPKVTQKTTSKVTDVSQKGLDFIAKKEVFVPKTYPDAVGKITVGYGHVVLPGENFDSGLSKSQAWSLLEKDSQKFVNVVNKSITVPLNQNEFDALTSFSFNLGQLSSTSSIYQTINSGTKDPEKIKNVFGLYNKGRINGKYEVLPGLVNRRADEANLFLYGKY